MAWLRDVIEYDSDQVVNKSFFFQSCTHTHHHTEDPSVFCHTHTHTHTDSAHGNEFSPNLHPVSNHSTRSHVSASSYQNPANQWFSNPTVSVCVGVDVCVFQEVRDIAHMACWPGTSIYYTREVKLTVIKAVWKYRPETSQLLTLHRAESVCMIHRGQINFWQIELVSQNRNLGFLQSWHTFLFVCIWSNYKPKISY